MAGIGYYDRQRRMAADGEYSEGNPMRRSYNSMPDFSKENHTWDEIDAHNDAKRERMAFYGYGGYTSGPTSAVQRRIAEKAMRDFDADRRIRIDDNAGYNDRLLQGTRNEGLVDVEAERRKAAEAVAATEWGARKDIAGTEWDARKDIAGTEWGARKDIAGTEWDARYDIADTEGRYGVRKQREANEGAKAVAEIEGAAKVGAAEAGAAGKRQPKVSSVTNGYVVTDADGNVTYYRTKEDANAAIARLAGPQEPSSSSSSSSSSSQGGGSRWKD